MKLSHINQWYDDIRLEVPGAPNPLIRDRVLLAAIEVCKRTLVSNETLDPIDIIANENTYELCPPNNCLKIWRVMWMKTINHMLIPNARQQLVSRGADWGIRESETPTAWIQITNSTVQLYPKPTMEDTDGLTAHCAFIPAPKTDMIDDRLWCYSREAILAGAVSKILRIAGAPWFNLAAANQREREFQVELNKIKANTYKDESVADLSVAAMRFDMATQRNFFG